MTRGPPCRAGAALRTSSNSASAATANAFMLAARSAEPISGVLTISTGPLTSNQARPGASP